MSTRAVRQKLLAVASGGGHWVQLLRLRPAFVDCDVVFVTVNASYRSDLGGSKLHVVHDASRWNKLGLLLLAMQIGRIIAVERPDAVISTGAAPGYLALRLARLVGARTVWVDSFANAEEMSLSGRRIGPHADLWLTQWPDLAKPGGPFFCGSVL